TISGEGAGHYLPGTDGQHGDWCHRSRLAEVDQVKLPGVPKKINLGCSGAKSSDIGFGDKLHYDESSQAARLTAVAERYRVVAVVVGTGANDDPQFANTLTTCVGDWLNGTSCFAGFGDEWRARVRRMRPKVASALTDVRTAMSRAHYARSDYSLVLQSYAAPVGPDIAPGLQGLAGCPLRTDDLRWIRNTGVTVLDNGLRAVAKKTGTRFLDLSRAGIGHEACSGGKDIAQEWFTRLTVDWQDLVHDDRAPHALQASFHPNARGYKEFAGCLTEFLGTDTREASCLPGTNGTLHAAQLVPPR
ncbi:MAG: GDSL-type esterase/lipase family protein, partial [Sciscionella sp.]